MTDRRKVGMVQCDVDLAVSAPELNLLPDLAMVVQFPAMTILDVNSHAVVRLGYSVEDVIGRSLPEFGEAVGSDKNAQIATEVLGGAMVHFDRRVRTAAGEWRDYSFAARAFGDDSGRFLLIGREMTDLAHSHSRLADLLKLADLTDDLFHVTDERGIITYVNDAVSRIYGHEEFVGIHVAEFVHEDDTGWPLLVEQMKKGSRAEGRVTCRAGDGSAVTLGVRTVFDHESRRWFTVQRDVSASIEHEREMARLNEHLRVQAMTDSLTGVANRHALNELLASAIGDRRPFVLLLLDMDDFKSVNDSLGHEAGDEFLRCVAHRIEGVVRDADVVARLGGDEFVVFLPGVGVESASWVADRIIETVGRPYSIAGTSLSRTCSIGIAVAEVDDEASDVLRNADRAAYRAKYEGRNRYAVY